jgi:microcystin degradation protein MlrC
VTVRLALLGFSHETNTFSPTPASLDRFAVHRGDEIVRLYGQAHHSLTGFLQAAEVHGVEVVPLVYAHTGPIGLITRHAFDTLVGEMLDLLRRGGPWDGVLLANHGAAVAEGQHDVDGEIAVRVRELVGAGVPVGMAMDLHGNITERMVEAATAVVFYRTNPHLDARERALECADIVVRAIRGEVRPVMALETPPLVINIVMQWRTTQGLRDVPEPSSSRKITSIGGRYGPIGEPPAVPHDAGATESLDSGSEAYEWKSSGQRGGHVLPAPRDSDYPRGSDCAQGARACCW